MWILETDLGLNPNSAMSLSASYSTSLNLGFLTFKMNITPTLHSVVRTRNNISIGN